MRFNLLALSLPFLLSFASAQYGRGGSTLRMRSYYDDDELDIHTREPEKTYLVTREAYEDALDALTTLHRRHDEGCTLVTKPGADYGRNCTTQCSTVCEKGERGCRIKTKGNEVACGQCKCQKA